MVQYLEKGKKEVKARDWRFRWCPYYNKLEGVRGRIGKVAKFSDVDEGLGPGRTLHTTVLSLVKSNMAV